MGIDFRNYEAPGPVGAAFIKSRGPIDIIMGPAGSGKTVASCIKGPLLAASYMPVCKDGWVHFKIAVVRDTYRDFARTFLQSWHELFPQSHPWTTSYEGGQDRPIKHRLQWEAWRGNEKIKIDYQLETGAIGDHNVEGYIKGYELSAASGNEVDLLDARVPGLLFQRTGRYPPVEQIAPSELERVSRDGRAAMQLMGLTVGEGEIVLPRVFWGDMNPPDIDHPILVECLEKKNPAWKFFQQPGGLEPTAENRKGKPRSSYELEAATQPEHIVRRMVHGLPGYAQDGKPVYPEFNLRKHVSDQQIGPVHGLPIGIGVDGGGSPAAVIGQFMANGQLRITDELAAEPGTGPARFAQMLVDLLLDRYRGCAIRFVAGDPANFHSPDTQAGELSFMMIIQKALTVPVMPAPSNEPSLRQEAVRWYMGAPIDGTTERMVINPDCKLLIGGFAAHYKLTKQATASGTDKLAVVKNKYSHPHDALQYLCLFHRGAHTVIEEAGRMGRPENVHQLRRQQQKPVRRDFSVWDV